jgi:magnesium-transporting ATPase (P-type)
MLAEKEIPENQYETWNQGWQEAMLSFTNREEKLDKLSEEIERNLDLIGATAIEDKL